MNIACPTCHQQILLDDINVSKDIALCRRCEKTFSFADLTADRIDTNLDLTKPPNGTWFQSNPRGFVLGATTRSAEAFFLVPFTAFWSGLSMTGIYGAQIMKGELDWGMSLFGLPFLAGTCYLVPTALMKCCGKQELRVESGQGALFTGIGPIGWRRRFDWRSVARVRAALSKWQQNNRSAPIISLEGTKTVRFGSMINEERRDYMLNVLKSLVGKNW